MGVTDVGSVPMVHTTSNNDGMFGGGGGLFGGFLLGALLSGRNGLLGGNADNGACANGNMFNGFMDVNKGISDTRYEVATDTLSQTIALQPQIAKVGYDNVVNTLTQTNQFSNRLCEIDKEILENKYQVALQTTQLGNIIQQGNCANVLANTTTGYEGKIATMASTSTLQKAIDDCCCATNLRMTELAGQAKELDYQDQLRNLTYKCDTDKQLSEIKCGQAAIIAHIDNTALKGELCATKRELAEAEKANDRYWDTEVARRGQCLTKELGNALHVQFGPTFPWSIPVCGCN